MNNHNPVQHSKLFHIDILGQGTCLIESPSSILQRLAGAHNVIVADLIREILPLLDSRHKQARMSIGYGIVRWAQLGSSINGLNSPAREWISAIGQLTGHPHLERLTMLAWSDVISERHLTRTD